MLHFAMLSLPAQFRQIISQGLLLGSLLTPCGICGITIPFCNRAPLVLPDRVPSSVRAIFRSGGLAVPAWDPEWFDCDISFVGFVIATDINPDEPSAVAPCDDLSNFANRRVSSLARKNTHLKHQRGMKLRILS
jgi:hypothetical protein